MDGVVTSTDTDKKTERVHDMTENVLVIAAHPDDEALGCGGTMARLVAEGKSVHVAFLADGITARPLPDHAAELAKRRDMALNACQIMGCYQPVFFDYPDNRLDTVALLDLVQTVESLIERFNPQTVITHHHGDLNIDHQRVHQAVMTACRPLPDASVRRIWCFEVPSSTEWQTPLSKHAFQPSLFVDISDTLAIKMKALQSYGGEMRPWPHSRAMGAVEHLARWRGASVGVDAAEAFMVARDLI
jgi:N-acetylglucosamine malate deacetylase 1